MKKILLVLSFVLGLSVVSTSQAQMKIYNSNLVKFGNVNTAPTLSSGFEVNMTNLLFNGKSIKFDISGSKLEFMGGTASNAMAPINGSGDSSNNFENPAPMPGFFIIGAKNDVVIGSTMNPLYSISATTIYRKSEQTLSDLRYKTNIQNLGEASEKLMQLRPVKFDYLEEKNDVSTIDSVHMNNIGLIAQELQEVYPEAVQHLLPEDVYTIDYTMLIPVLIKAVQEQQEMIEDQQMQIEELQILLTEPKSSMGEVQQKNASQESPALKNSVNRLWRNVPNPFKEETRIRYALAETISEAQLCIYDLSGKQLFCYRLNDRGESEFVLRASTLMPGIYLYSLIADGVVEDTHRMVVTE